MSASNFNNRLQNIIDTVSVKIWMSDENGDYYNFNKKWLAFRGKTIEQESKKGWLDGIHVSDTNDFLKTVKNAYASHKAFETEIRLRRADGVYRVMNIKGEPDYAEGKFCGFVGTCVDITDSKLKKNNAINLSLLDEANAIAKVGGWEYNYSAGKITWSGEMFKIFELNPSEHGVIDAKHALNFCHADDREPLKSYIKQLVETGRSFNIEFRIITSTNNLKWVRVQGNALKSDDGFVRIIGALQDVTDQRNADMALIESERKLHFVLDGLPVAVYLTDARGAITNFNKAAEDVWGKKPDTNAQWCGSYRLYSAGGKPLPGHESPMASAVMQNKVIHGEEVISECENGSRTNLLVFSTPYKSTNNETEGALNVLVDITERKQLEEKLTSLSLVARKTSNAVIISDAEGRITWANQSFTKLSGYPLNEAIGKRPSDFLHCEETNRETVEYVYSCLAKQQAVRFEILNKGKNGNKYWLDVDVQPLRDDKGALSGYISVETDITELKYIHEELKKSENKLRAILDSTSDDNVIVDPDYKIISVNKVATQHLNRSYGKPPAIGEPIWNYVNEELKPEFEITFRKALEGHASKTERLLPVNGRHMWFEFCFYPVYTNDGSIIAVAINSKNIHGKKVAELKVQHQNKKLKEIAFTQSHTLRRPVANILGLWNLINHDRKIEQNTELYELMNYMGKSVNEMDEVIREITRNTSSLDV